LRYDIRFSDESVPVLNGNILPPLSKWPECVLPTYNTIQSLKFTQCVIKVCTKVRRNVWFCCTVILIPNNFYIILNSLQTEQCDFVNGVFQSEIYADHAASISSEKSVHFYATTRRHNPRHIPGDCNIHYRFNPIQVNSFEGETDCYTHMQIQ
jgi:hypothetical protein